MVSDGNTATRQPSNQHTVHRWSKLDLCSASFPPWAERVSNSTPYPQHSGVLWRVSWPASSLRSYSWVGAARALVLGPLCRQQESPRLHQRVQAGPAVRNPQAEIHWSQHSASISACLVSSSYSCHGHRRPAFVYLQPWPPK